MATIAYARKKRQLKQLSSKLHTALLNKSENPDYIQKLILKIKTLLQDLRRVVSAKDLKRALGAMAVFFGLAGSQNLSAQTFAAPVQNPFGLTGVVTYAIPAFADLDGDGDLDALVGEEYGQMLYFQNTGTATAPQFAAPVTNPFGINDSSYFYLMPTLVDIDDDGDLDLFVGDFYDYYGTRGIRFMKNSGTATMPQFDPPVDVPFGISSLGISSLPTFVDLDNDGDFDLVVGEALGTMKYFENTGTKSAPQFVAPLTNPFGLTSTYGFAAPAFADLDGDGDMDLLVGEYYGALQYFQNTGSASSPQFAAQQTNPFGLAATYYAAYPTFADLDNDGDMDLMVGEYYGTMQYFENTTPKSSLSERAAFKVKLFPNPAVAWFELEMDTEPTKVEILDATGKLVGQYINPNNKISVAALPAGTYLIKVYNRDEEVVTQKLNKL